MVPTIDVSPLRDPASVAAQRCGAELDRACRELGFFCVVGHGVAPQTIARLDRLAREFFALPQCEKENIAMVHGGAAWRGWFPLGGELTSGQPDHKEGVYFGVEHPAGHPRVLTQTPLHGANLFPLQMTEFREAVLGWISQIGELGLMILRGIALGLGLAYDWFDRNVVSDPTLLFRIFHYPPGNPASWGVGEHTDYGLLTVLLQDDCGGLQVKSGNDWLDVPPQDGVFVCNLGDMLDRLTNGVYRSTLHRVRNNSGRQRLSFPLFVDPAWDARVTALPHLPVGDSHQVQRWDGNDLQLWQGLYGDYLTAKVRRVFPTLFESVTPPLTAK